MLTCRLPSPIPGRPLSNRQLAGLIHARSAGILTDVGFCLPDSQTLARLEAVGFPVDRASEMVRIASDLLEDALATLLQEVALHDGAGEEAVLPNRGSCLMGARTAVNARQ